jgi:zinc D-Ala-D-Ala carboxypeptidase
MRLSKHFTLEEMTKSMTAARKGIDNTPGSGEIHNLTEVCYNILEPLRANLTSQLQSHQAIDPKLCVKPSAAKKQSQHAKGQAVDLEIMAVPNIKIAYWIEANCDFDQLILEYYKPDDGQAGWVHVSYNEKGANRKQVLTFDGKKYENGLPEMKWKDGQVVE